MKRHPFPRLSLPDSSLHAPSKPNGFPDFPDPKRQLSSPPSSWVVALLSMILGLLPAIGQPHPGEGKYFDSGTQASAINPPIELPSALHRTIVIAHRGEHLRHHENTLEAIEGAIAAGADYTEMDIRRSEDGRYLLMHDGTVDRMTDGHGKVADLSWEALSHLVVRDRRLTNVPPSRIPLFEEALQACKGRIYIYLDFKAGDRKVVASMVQNAGMDSQVMVYDGAYGIPLWRAVAPTLPIITSPPEKALSDRLALEAFVARYNPQALDQAPEPGNGFLQLSLKVKLWPDIQRADENPTYWKSIWDRGIRGFQTDHPAELSRWLQEQGLR